ncbi:MAG: hypothetical protein WCZ89_06185 [Phycisphaerae bacterium]
MRILTIKLNILTDKQLAAVVKSKTDLIAAEAKSKTELTRKICVEQIISYAKLDMKLKERMKLLCLKCSKIMSS